MSVTLNPQQFGEQMRLFDEPRPEQLSFDFPPHPSRPAAVPPSSRQAGIRHSYGEMTQRQWRTHSRLSRMGW